MSRRAKKTDRKKRMKNGLEPKEAKALLDYVLWLGEQVKDIDRSEHYTKDVESAIRKLGSMERQEKKLRA